ncbi:MAG: hypothetical protein IKY82_02640 [Alistipes sp.]|nr:hypothetical protein [Alistipes sp.]
MRARVKIDGRYCDVEEGFTPPRNIVAFSDEECAPKGEHPTTKVRISLPATATNDSILGLAMDAFTAERFNAEQHTASIEVDAVELLSGEVALEGVTFADGKQWAQYDLAISRRGADWRGVLQQRKLSEVQLEFSATLTSSAIEQSWSGSKSVRFLPVHYDQYVVPYDEQSLFSPHRSMTVEDYMPFISVRDLVRQIFADAGYQVKGQMVDSDLFRKLYIVGRYEQSTASAVKLDALAGFCAGRESDATATASSLGRVHLSKSYALNSLGNFVTTTDRSIATDLYDNSAQMVVSGTRPYYTSPLRSTMRFEYYIKYTTDFSIQSRTRLKGFDGIYIDSSCDTRLSLANPYIDRRQSLVPNMSYHCIVFDHAEGARYRLMSISPSGESILAQFQTRSAKVATPMDWNGVDCVLEVAGSDGRYTTYKGDWAMYDGFVEDSGTTEVEVTITTPPEELGPSQSRYFDTMYLYGAEAGQRVTLSKECRLRTVFSLTPSLGSQLTTADIMHYDCTQEEFVDALQQMFNLRICVGGSGREVYIEPKAEFYAGEVCDWSDRIVLSESIASEHLASAHRRVMRLGYRVESDGAVGRFNRATGEKLGEWSVECCSQLATEGVERNGNPLFCPTMSATGVFGAAPSAALLQIGDRDGDVHGDSEMRIVRYEGLQTLPDGEVWGFPSYGSSYPLATFHFPAQLCEADGAAMVGGVKPAGPRKPFTLCFEDRDGAAGLASYYADELTTLSRRSRVRLALRISPEELSQMSDCNGAGPSRRSLFRLSEGQSAIYRLYAIEGYDTQRGVAYCTMERVERD